MSGLGKAMNALEKSALSLPEMDLVGPTVDDDIRRAINRYGKDAVKEAVKRLTGRKTGRPKVNDWKELKTIIEADAVTWLEGGDPFAERSNYSIAKQIADENPGHSHPATMKRVQRKLAQSPHGRRWFTLVSAWFKSEKNYPHGAYFRTIEELAAIDPDGMWACYLERAEGTLSDYKAKHGEPDPDLTLSQIEEGARTPLNALLGLDVNRGIFGALNLPAQGSLTGLLANYTSKEKTGD